MVESVDTLSQLTRPLQQVLVHVERDECPLAVDLKIKLCEEYRFRLEVLFETDVQLVQVPRQTIIES